VVVGSFISGENARRYALGAGWCFFFFFGRFLVFFFLGGVFFFVGVWFLVEFLFCVGLG